MRLNECCQLDVADVVVRDSTDIILIRENDEGEPDKRVKTEAGERFVPVHPELDRLGFMKHVEAMRAAGESKLFPELPLGANGYLSDPYQKWFKRFLRHTGAQAPKTSFHSFRHSYRDALREADISIERVRALGGWAGNAGAEEGYGAGLRPSTLYREISKIAYPGLDLSHLMRISPGGDY